MKNFNVSFLLYHESYNGYNHCDGWSDFKVQARGELSAIKKAKKLVRSCYDIRQTQVNRSK